MAKAHLCDVPGCNTTRKRWQRLCEKHYAALPGDIRTAIIDAHQAHRKADWRRACRRAAEHLASVAAPAVAAAITPQRAFELNQRLLGER
ncbi:hypothetical protein [Novosphingobium guangzhouense]|uniref:Uncharacterized protein n=1 Tax=Novosphingobium guangzhouense TaxID=1850347 RepID=A0A2K2G5Z2_9SPHN|nr:hypothetical protein [Novosphingobium guangzhouense]PNU06449.1 hypothetical protein A8V01_02580 [Novosphingobium guangzhouense]